MIISHSTHLGTYSRIQVTGQFPVLQERDMVTVSTLGSMPVFLTLFAFLITQISMSQDQLGVSEWQAHLLLR